MSSDSKWQVAPGTEYVFSKVVALGLRYRTMPVDYDKDGLLYEMKVDLRLLAGILNIRRKCDAASMETTAPAWMNLSSSSSRPLPFSRNPLYQALIALPDHAQRLPGLDSNPTLRKGTYLPVGFTAIARASV